ncbi:redox-sensing transcriptional repressor [Hydrogenispora ethanolica]|jgi:redox-sensing transcriptional repressor|uniref:Redox-sensing transcriptional repressor Rex n=1 Tax=Hydrogenispora ethanolica TaxID=1082276 RepID=A0A4R1RD95_HYDET|nr:redox-sensing transcriptional repressor Rex [Hydrogenispora ethanolica]TCL63796.1 redox-sensing transcriptional repressor [Hydrogenispora ethanolica]
MDFKSNHHHKNFIDGVPYATVKRLPFYHRFLTDLSKKEVERISSRELAAKMGINPSQLRQDLCYFGSFGQQGYGYRVNDLLREVNRILGLNQEIKMVLVGGGHLGTALANYDNFSRRGFIIKAIFDKNPEVIGGYIKGIPVLDIKELQEYLRVEPVEIGVITTPAEAAQETADRLVQGGVKAIWNFAPVSLKVPEEVLLENMHISESLLLLSFKLKQRRNQPDPV